MEGGRMQPLSLDYSFPSIRYEPRLLAEVLLPLLGGGLRARYEVESNLLYEKHPPERRGEVFAALETRMFEELPQHDLFVRAVRDAGPLPGVRDLQVCCVGGRDEGADLEPSGEMAILRLCPRRVGGDAGALRAFLLHELTHLVDMLDPGFAYRCEDPAPGESRAWANLVRDRHRVLWNASVDGRLAGREEIVSGTEQERRREVRRAFGGSSPADADRLFEEAWSGRLFGHAALIAAARNNAAGSCLGLEPGGTCPLCDFSSWDIASGGEGASVAEAVRRDYPAWSPDEGLCARCLELYQIRSEEST